MESPCFKDPKLRTDSTEDFGAVEIEQVYARAGFLRLWEGTGAIASIEYSMSLDLSDMSEERFPSEPQPQISAPARGSLVVPIDKKAVLARSQKGRSLIQSRYWQN